MPALGLKLPQLSHSRRRRVSSLAPPQILPLWSSALSAVQSGVRNARILCIGDSTTAGHGALAVGMGNNNKSASYPTQLCGLLTARSGLFASWSSMTGTNGTSFTTGYDNRATFGSGQGWSIPSEFGANAQTAAGYVTRQNAGSGNPYNFAPLNACDTFEFYYLQTNTTGAWTVSVNNTDKDSFSITYPNSNPGNMAKATVTHALGANVLNLRGQTGTTNSHYFAGIIAYNSAVKEITVLNAGWDASNAGNWNNGQTYAYSPLNSIAVYDPDLCVINLGINDAHAGIGETTYKNNMQAIINACVASGADVVLVIPSPVGSTAASALNTLSSWVLALAAANGNLPVVDLRGAFVDYATANAAGLMRDTLHPNAAGYGVIATAVADVIYPA